MPEKELAKGLKTVRPTEQQLGALTEALKASGVSSEDIEKQWQETAIHMIEYRLLPSPDVVALQRPAYERFPSWPWHLDQMHIHASEVLSQCKITFGPLTILPPGQGPGWNVDELASMPITITNHSVHRVNKVCLTLRGEGVEVLRIERIPRSFFSSPNPCVVGNLAAGGSAKVWAVLSPTAEGTPKISAYLGGDVVPYGACGPVDRTLPPVGWA